MGFDMKVGADIVEMKRKLNIPDFDDSFQIVQEKDFM
jgi:hypothetical protein